MAIISRYIDRAQCWSGTAVGTQPGDAGWLGPESGRAADSHGLGDETGIMSPPRMRTTSWDLGQPQLYNKRVVYNQKRHGTFLLGTRMVTFGADLTFQYNPLPSSAD